MCRTITVLLYSCLSPTGCGTKTPLIVLPRNHCIGEFLRHASKDILRLVAGKCSVMSMKYMRISSNKLWAKIFNSGQTSRQSRTLSSQWWSTAPGSTPHSRHGSVLATRSRRDYRSASIFNHGSVLFKEAYLYQNVSKPLQCASFLHVKKTFYLNSEMSFSDSREPSSPGIRKLCAW